MNFTKKGISFILFFTLILGNIWAQEAAADKSLGEKGKEKLKSLNAKDKFIAGNFQGALELYRDLLTTNKEDAMYYLRVGQCLVELNQGDLSLEYFEKAYKLNNKVDSKINLYLGIGNHRKVQLDQALEYFEKYKASASSKDAKYNEVDYYIAQVKTAKELIAHPVAVNVSNLGDAINSSTDDYLPCITADGKTLIYTSRRADTKGGLIDYEADGKFFEDIYMATWDDEKNKWNDGEPVKGSLNTEGHDACQSISADGHTILLYKNIPDETRSGDIYSSKLNTSGKWSSPHSLGPIVNSSYFESSACTSVDGNTLIFASERIEKTAQGNCDLWISTKHGHSDWSIPTNLGPHINTIEDEVSVFLHPDGKTLFFSSKGHNSMGGYDIFKTIRDEKGEWSKPINLGYPINTVNDDLHFTITTDGKTAYYSSNQTNKGQGGRDIYKVDLRNYPLMNQGNQEAVQLSIFQGKLLDEKTTIETDARIIISGEDGKELVNVNEGDGNFFFTLPAGKSYNLAIDKEGYNSLSEKISLPADSKGGTAILVKNYTLSKKP